MTVVNWVSVILAIIGLILAIVVLVRSNTRKP